MWNEAYRLEIDSERVPILSNRRRFPTGMVTWIQLDASSASAVFNHSSISTINKFIFLTLYKKPAAPSVFHKTAREVCFRFSENSQECFNEYGLNVSEIVSLLGVIIKNLYAAKSKCDIKAYLMNLDRYISWQSLTSPLSRFNPSQRKEILRNFGRKLCTFTQTIDMSKPTYISIY
jgi:hypothetical protein